MIPEGGRSEPKAFIDVGSGLCELRRTVIRKYDFGEFDFHALR